MQQQQRNSNYQAHRTMNGLEYTSANPAETEQVTIITLLHRVWQRRKVFYWVLPATFLIASALILCVPRYYKCEVLLAPESQTLNTSGSLMSLASSFGFDLNSMSKHDAIHPTIYPKMVKSQNFLIKLFDTPVKTADGSYEGTYYQYLQQRYRVPFWELWKIKLFSALSPAEEAPAVITSSADDQKNLFCMSNQQWGVIELMKKNISCTIDNKTDIITFSVTAQDKIVCAIVADSVCAAVQSFVADYRTIKNRTDMIYYEGAMRDAYAEYQKASEQYVRYMDSHKSTNLEMYRVEAENLKNEKDLKYSAYSSFQKQYLATQARLQENTPVFTVIQSATVPIKASGPRRVLFVLAMLVLVGSITVTIVCWQQLKQLFTSSISD